MPSFWSSDVCSRSEEHTSELQSLTNLVCRLLLEKKENLSISEIKLLMQKYKYKDALLIANQALESDSLNTEIYLLKGIALKESFNYSEAIKSLKKGLLIDETNVFLLAELANLYKITSDNQSAYETYSKLLLLDSENITFKIQMANTLLASAIYFNRKALEVNPNSIVLLTRLANLFIKTKNYQEGLQLTESFRQLDSTQKEVNKWCGYFYYLNKQYEPAIARFGQYNNQCGIGESSKFVNKYLGLSLYRLEQFQEAAHYFSEVYNADSTDSEVCFYLGVCHCRTFSPDTGLYFLSKTLNLITPENSFLAMIYSETGDAYNAKKETEKATEYIFKAYLTDSLNRVRMFKLAYQYDYEMDDRKTALAYYKKYLALVPEAKSNPESIGISYKDFATKRIKDIGKNISIANRKQI